MGFIKKLFKKEELPVPPEYTDEQIEQFDEAKQAALESLLGPMYDLVGHAVIPFAVGGAVDMYYFPQPGKWTAMATMELIEPDGSGPTPNTMGTYELVAFTRHSVEDQTAAFEKVERRLCGVLTTVGHYSYEARLEPGETAELPDEDDEDDEDEDRTLCLILDRYSVNRQPLIINGKNHGLLLCIEIFRSEMEYARKQGGAALLDKLKEAGPYPYSDMDRESVV